MSMVVAAFVGLVIYGMIRVLNLASPSLPPSVYSKTCNSEFIQALISSCPILREPYVPPLLWGKSGHAQTVVYSKVGRMLNPIPCGERHTKTLEDGSTLTFDLYEPTGNHSVGGQYCVLVCPGFGSSSESSYIRSLVNYAQAHGYYVSVLNHLGCLYSLPLTAPRIFSYGGWHEFHVMRQEVKQRYPKCKLVVVGLSMGANIVLKYLGEDRQHQQDVLCAISICQGYNINDAKKLLKMWQNMRRAYLYIMTANQLRLVKRHGTMLFTEDVCRQFGLDPKKIFSSTTLEDLDHHFTCKLQGYQDVVDYYNHCSCSNFMSNIDVPLIMLNAEDDPIVPESLLKYPKEYTDSHEYSALVTTKHGGHLGYFEHGYFQPDSTSWLDRFTCQVMDGVIGYTLRTDLYNASMASLHTAIKSQGLLGVKAIHEVMAWPAEDLHRGDADTAQKDKGCQLDKGCKLDKGCQLEDTIGYQSGHNLPFAAVACLIGDRKEKQVSGIVFTSATHNRARDPHTKENVHRRKSQCEQQCFGCEGVETNNTTTRASLLPQAHSSIGQATENTTENTTTRASLLPPAHSSKGEATENTTENTTTRAYLLPPAHSSIGQATESSTEDKTKSLPGSDKGSVNTTADGQPPSDTVALITSLNLPHPVYNS